jgi:transposase
MSNRKRRKNFTAAEKTAIVRQHLLEQVAISDLCDRHGMQPGQFYTWQKQLFENGPRAFEAERGSGAERVLNRRIATLETKLRQKDEVIAEIAEELVREKKGRGGV